MLPKSWSGWFETPTPPSRLASSFAAPGTAGLVWTKRLVAAVPRGVCHPDTAHAFGAASVSVRPALQSVAMEPSSSRRLRTAGDRVPSGRVNPDYGGHARPTRRAEMPTSGSAVRNLRASITSVHFVRQHLQLLAGRIACSKVRADGDVAASWGRAVLTAHVLTRPRKACPLSGRCAAHWLTRRAPKAIME